MENIFDLRYCNYIPIIGIGIIAGKFKKERG